ncbi:MULTISPECIES: 6-carboxytetrahydropterin synthase [unclassified Bradyrhizobium]
MWPSSWSERASGPQRPRKIGSASFTVRRSLCAGTRQAAHRLPNKPPTHRCNGVHGHSFRIEVQLD